MADAVAVVTRTVELLVAPERPHQAWQFDKQRDCRDLLTSLDALTEAVSATRIPSHAEALANLETLKSFCR